MSVIVRLSSMAKPHLGGVEVSVHETSKVLVSRGNKVIVVCYQPASGGPENEVLDGVIYVRRKTVAADALDNLKRFGTEIDLLSYEDFPAFEHGGLKSVSGAKRDLYYSHGYECFPLNPGTVAWRQHVASLVDYNIHVGSYIQKWYGYGASFVSYGGYPQNYKPLLISELGLNTISWVGRLAEDTGFNQALQAYRKVKEYEPSLNLAIFGDGPLKSLLSPEELQHFHGFVSDPMLKVTSCVVLCSGYLSILEALARRVYPISFYGNDLKKDYLQPFGQFLTAVNTVEDYAQAIRNRGNLKFNFDALQFLENNTWERTAVVIEKMSKGEWK